MSARDHLAHAYPRRGAGKFRPPPPEPGGEQLSLLDYPLSPGWKRRETSAEAAGEMAPSAPTLRERVRQAIARATLAGGARSGPGGGLTADEAARRLGLTPFTVRPRCTELSALGEIADSGQRRANESGRRAIVWVDAAQLPPAAAKKTDSRTKYERAKGR